MKKNECSCRYQFYVTWLCINGRFQEKLESKLFLPSTDKAVVYIYREPKRILSIDILSPTIDDQKIGETDLGTYLYKQLPPGKHTFNIVGSDGRDFEIDMKSNQIYFLRANGIIGLRTTHCSSNELLTSQRRYF